MQLERKGCQWFYAQNTKDCKQFLPPKKFVCLLAFYAIATIFELHDLMALVASLRVILLGQLLEFVISGLFFILSTTHVGMQWGVALRTEATMTSPTLHRLITLLVIIGYLHESRAILEGAIHPYRHRDGGLFLPDHKNLQVDWRQSSGGHLIWALPNPSFALAYC